jgi:hypothetical protein
VFWGCDVICCCICRFEGSDPEGVPRRVLGVWRGRRTRGRLDGESKSAIVCTCLDMKHVTFLIQMSYWNFDWWKMYYVWAVNCSCISLRILSVHTKGNNRRDVGWEGKGMLWRTLCECAQTDSHKPSLLCTEITASDTETIKMFPTHLKLQKMCELRVAFPLPYLLLLKISPPSANPPPHPSLFWCHLCSWHYSQKTVNGNFAVCSNIILCTHNVAGPTLPCWRRRERFSRLQRQKHCIDPSCRF